MNHEEVMARAESEGIVLVRFEYCDHSGVARTKSVHISQLAHKLTEGVGLTRAQMSIDLLEQVVPIAGMEAVGEIRLVPDLDTFVVLPWAKGSASLLCDQLDHDRQDWGACPRSYLKEMIGRAQRHGISVQASFENEYYLAKEQDGHFVPYDVPTHAPVYSPIGHDFVASLMSKTMEAIQASGMVVEQAINEYGPGQQEIAVRYSDALQSADNQIRFRDAVRGVALSEGLYASFAPKPYPHAIGSGAHIHFSLWDAALERNLLYDQGQPRGLSTLGRQFIAGVLDHLPALVALTAPSYNSYRRLQPSAWASATTSWGFDNKEAALRVASPFYGREEQSYNIEFKPSDASANPYLSLGAIIACGLDGIERELEPGPPALVDPATMSDQMRREHRIEALPTTMEQALDHLEADQCLMESLGDLRGRGYLGVRRSEFAAFVGQDEEFEIRHHFYRF